MNCKGYYPQQLFYHFYQVVAVPYKSSLMLYQVLDVQASILIWVCRSMVMHILYVFYLLIHMYLISSHYITFASRTNTSSSTSTIALLNIQTSTTTICWMDNHFTLLGILTRTCRYLEHDKIKTLATETQSRQ